MNAAEEQPEPQLAISESSPTVPQRQPLLMHWPATSAWEAAEGAPNQAAGSQEDAFASISSPPPPGHQRGAGGVQQRLVPHIAPEKVNLFGFGSQRGPVGF